VSREADRRWCEVWAELGAVLGVPVEVPSATCGSALVWAHLGAAPLEPVAVGLSAAKVGLRFAGWESIEVLPVSTDPGADRTPGEETREEALELALDFAAAALLGELRVTTRSRGRSRARSLEVCVGGVWRIHSSVGRLGLGAVLAAWVGKVEIVRRANSGVGQAGQVARLERVGQLAKAGPSGLARAPWAGAAGALSRPREPAELPLDGELDLHNFSPREVGKLVRAYIDACREQEVLDLRIVHGKGKGVLRRTVHAELDRHRGVARYRLGGHGEGSWGATVVRLRTPERGSSEDGESG